MEASASASASTETALADMEEREQDVPIGNNLELTPFCFSPFPGIKIYI